MSITVQACVAPTAGTAVTLASVYDQPGVVFLFDGVVYETQATLRTGGGYITVTRVSDGADHDLQSNSSVLVAQSAVLIATF
jgi:hypothetical protein